MTHSVNHPETFLGDSPIAVPIVPLAFVQLSRFVIIHQGALFASFFCTEVMERCLALARNARGIPIGFRFIEVYV